MNDFIQLGPDGRPLYVDVDFISTTLKKIKSVPLMTANGILQIMIPDSPDEIRRQYTNYLKTAKDENDFNKLVNDSANPADNVAMSRRVHQQTQTLVTLDGNLDKECVYINDGENPCDPCLNLGGTQMKYSEFVNNNMMPGDRCLGGNRCLCTLLPLG